VFSDLRSEVNFRFIDSGYIVDCGSSLFKITF